MTLDPTRVSIRVAMSAGGPSVPGERGSVPTVDPSVTAWAIEPDVGPGLRSDPTRYPRRTATFVDFDALDSVHETGRRPVRP